MTPPHERLDSLDALRGVAVLGILLMNVVSFGLPDPAYFNVTAAGASGVDHVIGAAFEVLADQKMMGIFSVLFGASIVLFVERVGTRRRHPVWLSLWRNLLLASIGVVHSMFWDGDVLLLYGVCAPVVLAVRRLPVTVLFCAGGAAMVAAAASGPIAQVLVGSSGGAGQLGWFWFDQDLDAAPVVAWFVIVDAVLRALGMMLIGVGLYRTRVLTGDRSDDWYRRAAVAGFVVGVPLSLAGVLWLEVVDHSWRHALVATAPNTLATAPLSISIIAVIVMLWRNRPDRFTRLMPVGRMALTNYLTQTVLGLVVLRGVFVRGELDRLGLLVFVAVVWVVQIWWSGWWLARFSQGPLEWVWRLVTYLRWTPLRRRSA
jgi:uncharacterized protein